MKRLHLERINRQTINHFESQGRPLQTSNPRVKDTFVRNHQKLPYVVRRSAVRCASSKSTKKQKWREAASSAKPQRALQRITGSRRTASKWQRLVAFLSEREVASKRLLRTSLSSLAFLQESCHCEFQGRLLRGGSIANRNGCSPSSEKAASKESCHCFESREGLRRGRLS